MNTKYNILTGAALFLISCGCFQSCQQDELNLATQPSGDVAQLVAQGRYLSALKPETFATTDDPDQGEWFDVNTPYRLFAFSKEYKEGNTTDKRAETFRFNFVAWEDSVDRYGANIHFINIDNEPAKWFGFKALPGENPGIDSLVSLDFYSFSYGKKAAKENYLPTSEPDYDANNLHKIYRTEVVSTDGGSLNDLLRAQLLDRNIDDVSTGNSNSSVTQSVLPFRHCFSRLRFLVVQEPKEKTEDDKKPGTKDEPAAEPEPEPCFGDIRIEEVKLTGTYKEGHVYLEDGKIALQGETTSRKLTLRESFIEKENKVTTKQVDMGEMIIFPSDGACLRDDAGNSKDSYNTGIEITVKSQDKTTLEKFLANNDPEGQRSVSGPDTDKWFHATLIESFITDNYDTELPTDPLHFKQNTAYTLVIAFMNNAVRIISVIPMVEEWLPGEGSDGDPWQTQTIGQPQMFDNVVWSDRNLGADDYDPRSGNFEKSMGYFYQAGRNIPYYPLKFKDYVDHGKKPTIQDLEKKQNFANEDTRWQNGNFRFYPVVDERILSMGGPYWWVINEEKKPQMNIPEVKPDDRYFDFMVNKALGDNNMYWDKDTKNQPTTGAWVIPTSAQFMSIFPSTPHAGNITFRTGGNNETPMVWGNGYAPGISATPTLRVTVPYYRHGSSDSDKPTWKSAKYQEAWQTLHVNKDAGTTHTELYTSGGPQNYVKIEPDGDPEDGYASIYVISKERDEDIVSLTPGKMPTMFIREWGTIYAIKRVYTPGAYRMRWRALIAEEGTYSPGIYIEICRYRCTPEDTFDETTYKNYDWNHPAARLYFPVCGLGDYPGQYINFGTECQYATSDPFIPTTTDINGKKTNTYNTSAVQIKITGDNAANAYIAIIKGYIDRHFGMQIRPIMGGG